MIITFILTFSSLRIFVWDSSVGEESTGLDSWVRKIRWRRDRLSIPVFLSFPCGSAGKESTHNAEDLGLIPGLGRFPWRRERLPPQVSWPGEFHGLYSSCGHKESDMTETFTFKFEMMVIHPNIHICYIATDMRLALIKHPDWSFSYTHRGVPFLQWEWISYEIILLLSRGSVNIWKALSLY